MKKKPAPKRAGNAASGTIKARGGQLSDKEWNFSEVPPDEEETCFLYEYGREMTNQWPRLKRHISLLFELMSLKAPKGHPLRGKWMRTSEKIHDIFERRFGDFPFEVKNSADSKGFPETCYQDLDKRQRARLKRMVVEGSHHYHVGHAMNRIKIQTSRELDLMNIKTLRHFAHFHEVFSDNETDKTEYGFFAIDWNYGNPEIVSAFKSWLDEQRKAHGFGAPVLRKKSRGGFSDKLTCLGALRIVDNYSPEEFGDYPNKVKGKAKALYSNLPELYAAAKKARMLVKKLRIGKDTPRERVKDRDAILQRLDSLGFGG